MLGGGGGGGGGSGGGDTQADMSAASSPKIGDCH